MGQLLDIAYNIELGADTVKQSSLNIVYLLGFQPVPGQFSIFGSSDEHYHLAGGTAVRARQRFRQLFPR